MEFLWAVGFLFVTTVLAWQLLKLKRLAGLRLIVAVFVCLIYAGIGIAGIAYSLADVESGEGAIRVLLAFAVYFIVGLYPVVKICQAIDWTRA